MARVSCRIGFLGICAFVMALVVSGAAMAQGFQVKPMTMQFGVGAGRVSETTLDLTNTSAVPLSLNLYTVELSQALDGSWEMVAPSSGVDVSNLSSAKEWVSISTSAVDVPAAAVAHVPIRFAVPADARGTYVAGIVAEQPTPETVEGLIVRVRFLIPVILQIEGRPVRQNVKLLGAGMQRIDAAAGANPSTTLSILVANEGKTFSRIRGEIALQAKSGDGWRTLTRATIAEKGMIPGVVFDLPVDIGRRLPSGTYRVRAELFVDGRRVSPLEKDIEFEGDPQIDTLAFDTALLLNPPVVNMDVVPGATRTTTLTIENPSDQPINVAMDSSTPKALQGMIMGSLVGSDLSAQPWTEIRPSEFTIRPGMRQNVRVISRIPKDGAVHPNYYADLVLQGTYANGQGAGETRSLVHLANNALTSVTSGAVEHFALSETDQIGLFSIQVRLVNTGNVHVDPSSSVTLSSPRGEVVATSTLTAEPGILLPLGVRTFGGDLNLGGIDPGSYVLRVQLPLSDGVTVSDQHILLLEIGDVVEPDGDVVQGPKVVLDPEASEIEIDVQAPIDKTSDEGAAADDEGVAADKDEP